MAAAARAGPLSSSWRCAWAARRYAGRVAAGLPGPPPGAGSFPPAQEAVRLSPGDFPRRRGGAGGGCGLGAAAAHADWLHAARLGGGAAAGHRRRRHAGYAGGSAGAAAGRCSRPRYALDARAVRVRPRGGAAAGAGAGRGERRGGHGGPLGGPAGGLGALAAGRGAAHGDAAGAQPGAGGAGGGGRATWPALRGKRLAVYPRELRPTTSRCGCSRARACASADVKLGGACPPRWTRAGRCARAGRTRWWGCGATWSWPRGIAAGQVLATTADAPHLIATVLVARGRLRGALPGRGAAGAARAAGRGRQRVRRTRARRRGCWARWRRTWGTRPRPSAARRRRRWRTIWPSSGFPARRRSPMTSCSRAPRRCSRSSSGGGAPPAEDTRDLGRVEVRVGGPRALSPREGQESSWRIRPASSRPPS